MHAYLAFLDNQGLPARHDTAHSGLTFPTPIISQDLFQNSQIIDKNIILK